MIVAIDFDGTITSNFSFYHQLSYLFKKSGHKVIVLSGCNPARRKEVHKSLNKIGFPYDILICRPESVKTGPSGIGKWKKETLLEYNVDLWFDNEAKNYEDQGIDFSKLKIVRA